MWLITCDYMYYVACIFAAFQQKRLNPLKYLKKQSLKENLQIKWKPLTISWELAGWVVKSFYALYLLYRIDDLTMSGEFRIQCYNFTNKTYVSEIIDNEFYVHDIH